MNPAEPPSGRVTLIFTDIEDSSRMTSALGEVYRENLLPEHNQRVRASVAAHNGLVVKTIGDSFMLAFQQATDAVTCAAAIQEVVTKPALTATDESGKTWTIKVRIGVHQSIERLEPRPSPECPADYFGSDVNFAARVESLGAGGQIVVSNPTHDAAKFGTQGQSSFQWKEWPNRRIKSFDQPETVWELLWDGQSRGEPGSRFLPDWFKGEQNRYIPRPELESAVLAQFGKLRSDGSVPRIVTLHAYGGMGKTRLAVACAVQVVGLFHDGVLFVRLDDRPPNAPAVAEAVGAALGLAREAALPDKVLAALRDKDLLLLLDNYESVDSEEVQTFLIELIKSTRAVRLLVTGREAVKLSDVEQEVSLDEGMTDAQADALYLARARLKHKQGQQWLPDDGEQAAIRRIVRLSERIPVAIELAAAWVSHSSVKEIADGIEATPLGNESKEPPRSGRIDQALRHRSLTRSLNYSYERLEPRAREGFARLGLFAGSFAHDSVAGACGVPQAKDLLFRLQDASLIHRVESDGQSRFTMLRPTRAYAAEKLSALPEVSSLFQQFVRFYCDAAKQKELLTKPGAEAGAKIAALDWFEEEWPNLLAAAQAASETEDCKSVLDICHSVFRFREVRGHWAEVEELYNLGLVASRKSNDRDGEGLTLDNMGVIYSLQSRWAEAGQVLQQSLAIRRELKYRQGEASTLNNLGNLHRAQGRWVEAEQAFQQSLVISREFKDRHREASPLSNLGLVYQAQGRWAEAEKAFQQSLAIYQEFGDRHNEAGTLINVGVVYRALGRWAEAEKTYQQSLAICREFKDRQGEGHCLNNLAAVYQVQSRWAEAEKTYQQSLAIYREFEDRRNEGIPLNNLGAVLKAQGRWGEAEKVFQQSLAIRREFKDRLGEASILNNLGTVYQVEGRWAEAEKAYQQSLTIYREFKDRHSEASPLGNLGMVYRAQGRLAEAEQALQQSLAIFREFKERPSEGVPLNNLGEVFRAQGRLGEAEQAFQQSLAIFREFKDRQGEASPLGNLGMIYQAQGRLAEAEQALHQSLAIYREFKDRHSEGVRLNNLGGVCRAQGRFAEAELAFQQSLAIKRELKDRQGEGQILYNLALLKTSQGDARGVLMFAREAIAVLEKTNDQESLRKARDILKQLEALS